ncbi:hypothetical protein JTE90_000572 [Oedothorax gibbosus]|uniref:C2H2-type domain-containing protein n=1 Tax=Oedothorax gibbosus TaxID=931172 RepID=A0AAV6VXE4_9ARAC|nr:hypothetical protein JTE90_000572 [Oedothorax gibbosus]
MASTPEQVVCTPTFVFPTAFPVNGFQIWGKDDQKGDVLAFCNNAPWNDYRGFDPRNHLANFHVAAAAASQSQPLQHTEDNSKGKGGNRGVAKNHISNQNDFSAARNLLVASAPPAFPGIPESVGLKIPNPNIDKQTQQQQQQQAQQQQQQAQQQQQQQQQTAQQQQQSQTQQQSQQQHPHQHTHEDGTGPLVDKDGRLWPCPSCKVPFKQASELQAHLSSHTKGEQRRVPCDVCGKCFASNDRVRIHVKSAHGEKSCSCEVCGSGFSYRCKLLDHMRTHSGEKPFHCEVCGKSFSQKNHLTRHSMIHTGERPYPCDFCGRQFYRKDKLTRHRRIHTGEKPFHCGMCGKSFLQKFHLVRHSMIHTGERPYPCDFCGRGFYRKDKLARHRRIHTGERVTGQPRKRGGGQFNAKMPQNAAARHNSIMAHHVGTSVQNPTVPSVASAGSSTVKMESTMNTEQPIPSTTASTVNLSFAPPTLTPTISPSHYRASPYKPEWQSPPSGVN